MWTLYFLVSHVGYHLEDVKMQQLLEEIISTEVCSPSPPLHSKVVYKDNFSKFRYGYVMKQKSEVNYTSLQMIAHEKSLDHTIKELLSDTRGEFNYADIKKLLSENGTCQRFTAPIYPSTKWWCSKRKSNNCRKKNSRYTVWIEQGSLQ